MGFDIMALALAKSYTDQRGGDIPEALPNPYALTFTGAVTGSYDGSEAVSVEIPSAVTVSSVSESTADGGENIVTFSDGKALTVKNGSRGSQGKTGATGAKGETGKSAYASAQDGGFTGTEAQFNKGLSVMGDVSGIDTTVTQNSGHLITSGAVYSYIQSLNTNEVKY